MRITEVRIKLMDDPSDRLSAFCSITLDECFVIRDLKIIQGAKGAFVAMPSRKLTDRCPKCHSKNHLRASFCNQCGVRLHAERASKDDDGRAKLYADIAHPINSECRDQIQQMVIAAFEEELLKSKQDGYICTYDDFEEDRYATLNDYHEIELGSPAREQPVGRSAEGNSPLNFETETGKRIRVDHPVDQDRVNVHDRDSQREHSRSSEPARRTGDGFGEGII